MARVHGGGEKAVWRKRRDKNSRRGWRGLFAWRMDRPASSRVPWAGWLDGELTTAGRHPDSDIFLDDVTVSRRHAEFYRQGARFTVRDVGSLNGTYVNRERIEEAELIGGDEVQIGKFRLLFLTSQDLGPAPSADRRGRGAQDYA